MVAARKRTHMPPDLAKYRKHVAHFDMSQAQQDALIHMVHIYMDNFVGRGFGDDPTQICIEGQAVKSASHEVAMLDCESHAATNKNLTSTFNAKKGTQ